MPNLQGAFLALMEVLLCIRTTRPSGLTQRLPIMSRFAPTIGAPTTRVIPTVREMSTSGLMLESVMLTASARVSAWL